jgi:hypothetical protein
LRVSTRLAEACEGVRRYIPHEAEAARMRGALIVDTRVETQRAEAGELPGAVVIDRTVFDWAPRSGERRADR